MPLNNNQSVILKDAIENYGFPPVYFDFYTNVESTASSMIEVERYLNDKLLSANPQVVLHGLANVIYWGYAQIGYRNVRVRNFLDGATEAQAISFQNIIVGGSIPTMRQIKDIQMPEFSGISFISKILAFLNPDNYCVLDQQLARIATANGTKALCRLTRGQQIRVTVNNQIVYNNWRNECREISNNYFGSKYRVVDIERGFFQLVQTNRLHLAQQIYLNA